MRRKTPKFKIGEVVEIDKWKAIKIEYLPINGDVNQQRKTCVRSNYGREDDPYCPKDICFGLITGMKRFIEGKYYAPSKSGWSYDGPDYDYEPGGVIQENMVTCWCVRTGYLNKELYFFEEDIVEVDPIYRHDIPMLDTGWTKKAREQMRRESKEWDRDKKGRFC